MQSNHWLPLTEYALRSGLSISTLRRKIKSNSIEYRMEEGRYLIRSDEMPEEVVVTETKRTPMGFSSSDQAPAGLKVAKPKLEPKVIATPPPVIQSSVSKDEMEKLRAEMRQAREEDSLRWRALEARVSGIAKKLETFSEQISELKMLVKIFEEKLDARY